MYIPTYIPRGEQTYDLNNGVIIVIDIIIKWGLGAYIPETVSWNFCF